MAKEYMTPELKEMYVKLLQQREYYKQLGAYNTAQLTHAERQTSALRYEEERIKTIKMELEYEKAMIESLKE
jgi:hypothetical protein